MFFATAAGQLIPFIVTVCLPLVFFISGFQRTDIQQQENHLKIEHHEVREVSVAGQIDFSLEYFIADFSVSCNNLQDFDFQKIPLENTNVKWKKYCLYHSGNKAPPVLF